MKNVTMQVTGSTLTITVDLTKTYGPSKSGKTTIIASTEGNVQVPNGQGAVVGLNVYKAKG
jgi:RecA/RadA recombinase